MTIKDELLKGYAKKEPRNYFLLDVHQIGPGYDTEDPLTGLYANEHGLCIMVGGITELSEAAGEGGLRILIGRKMSREKIEQALRHVLEEVDFPEASTAEEDQEIQGLMRKYEQRNPPKPEGTK
jgi:hypothetical protein